MGGRGGVINPNSHLTCHAHGEVEVCPLHAVEIETDKKCPFDGIARSRLSLLVVQLLS